MFITDAYAQSVDVDTAAEEFAKSITTIVKTYGSSSLYNTDQSGFQLSMHPGRTIAEQGVKNVFGMVQSLSTTMHSYAIQATIAADGTVLLKLFPVLQEVNGGFGPKVRNQVDKMKDQHDNAYTIPSKSKAYKGGSFRMC